MSRRSSNSVPERPTHKELSSKIKQAKEFLKRGQWYVLNVADFRKKVRALGISNCFSDWVKSLESIFDEIHPNNYQGLRPPERSYELEIENAELYVFIYYSNYFRQNIYFKFVIFNEQLVIVSLHKS